jgi:hypothetical protein
MNVNTVDTLFLADGSTDKIGSGKSCCLFICKDSLRDDFIECKRPLIDYDVQ